MKLSDLRTHDDIVAGDLEDPEYRAEWERTRFAHEVAQRVIQYRIDHDLTQAELAQQLGMSFHIDITPTSASELSA